MCTTKNYFVLLRLTVQKEINYFLVYNSESYIRKQPSTQSSMCKLYAQNNTPTELQLHERPEPVYYCVSVCVNAVLALCEKTLEYLLYQQASNQNTADPIRVAQTKKFKNFNFPTRSK